MDENKLRSQIHYAIDTHSPLPPPKPDRVERVLRAATSEGEVVVKKKLSLGLVLAIALMLITLTAFAVGLGIDEIWRNSFEKMNTTGVIDTVSYPQEGDMTAEEAIALAREAIVSAYGTTDEEFDRMGVYPQYFAHGYDEDTPDAPAEWKIYFSSRQNVDIDQDTTDYGPDGEYRVYLNAETKEITYCNWYTNNFWSKAQRIWDCGSYDQVYREYQQPSFYGQSVEMQEYFTALLASKGYETRSTDSDHKHLLLAAHLELMFRSLSEVVSEDDPQVAAAWDALEKAYGLNPELMRQYSYTAARPDWETETDDICIVYTYEDEWERQETGQIDWFSTSLFSQANRLGLFMVSFEKGTVNVEQITQVPFYEYQKVDCVTEGKLLEKTVWTADDFIAFDTAYQQMIRAGKRLEAAGISAEEMQIVARDFLYTLGDANCSAAPEDVDASQWFADASAWDALIPAVSITNAQAREMYGSDTRFWPMEIQAMLLNGFFSCPQEGEMTEQEAVDMALQAVREAYGQDAIDALGSYTVGCQLYRYVNEGPVTRWHIYITDDPTVAGNGWQVIMAFRNGELWGKIDVLPIAQEGVG